MRMQISEKELLFGMIWQKSIARHPEMRPRQFAYVCTSYLNNGLLRNWLDL